jgi:hypothetical protein
LTYVAENKSYMGGNGRLLWKSSPCTLTRTVAQSTATDVDITICPNTL